LKHILSLGAGVQSSVMALMATKKEITPMPDLAIFADTQAEPDSVYRWLDWLETQVSFPVLRVTAGNLAEEAVKIRTSSKTGMPYLRQDIPAHTLNESGEHGITWRQCTARFKIEPIFKIAKEWKSEGVTMWMGISTDEAQRMKDSPKPWVLNRYPLIERRFSRSDCFDWMERHGYPAPPRSSCVFCPYHSDKEWLRLKNEEPSEFAKAVKFEKQLQTAVGQIPRLESQYYLHSSCTPLDEVVFKHENQPNLFGNECEGMCGV
jgi:hypothetical protein